MSLREQIARIIDPAAFRRFDRFPQYASHIPREMQMAWTPRVSKALGKADEVLAMMEARK